MDPQNLFYLLTALGTLLVFASDLVGNSIAFTNRFSNALVTSIVWGVVFVILYFVLSYPAIDIKLATSISDLARLTLSGIVIVFFADGIGNIIAFGNRFVNALVTAIIWAIVFVAIHKLGVV